ncbi:prolyl oligopeptidase family serine peptidase [Paenibacillus sp. GYB004]|uniref:hypothetical protein n=1 Tax=Paenibacillus sp. GYB004 TaxID=2994393 RepID=UPI002F968336
MEGVMEKRLRSGSLLRIYRFGGEGNDWCFVRTPPGYKPDGRRHPLLICNHGNGWTMDGSERAANFSGKTQYGVDAQNNGLYLDESIPGFEAYSNPTIESFLEAGYIVCGAQNDADLSYGNEACRQACAAFYRHLTDEYRADRDNVFMLGCSNGFMTTLNTAALLGRHALRALIGLYPLCSLGHACRKTHRQGVMAAYGIGSCEQFAELAPVYDPQQRDAGLYPPTLLLWSSTDGVLPMEHHALPLAARIRKGGGIVRSVQIDESGEECRHGDWRHYRSLQMVDWCEEHRSRKHPEPH